MTIIHLSLLAKVIVMYTVKHGKLLLENARKAIELYVKEKKVHKIQAKNPLLNKKVGIFVTLNTHPEKELRGCIGFIQPDSILKETLPQAAVAAATQDPRFSPLTEEELDKITAEISILSEPQLIKATNPKEILKQIEPGKDGLILKKGNYSGLFLPQVWNMLPEKEQFLSNLCFKAGLMDPQAWKDAQLFKFKVQAFEEEEPRGKVVIKQH